MGTFLILKALFQFLKILLNYEGTFNVSMSGHILINNFIRHQIFLRQNFITNIQFYKTTMGQFTECKKNLIYKRYKGTLFG